MKKKASPFMTALREEIRLRGYSIKTEKTYLEWTRQYIRFIKHKHPSEVGAAGVKAFLTFLAVKKNVAINTQKSALNALNFLYAKHLKIELGDLGFQLATRQRILPSVLTPVEVKQILDQLSGRNLLIVELLYGSGLRTSIHRRAMSTSFALHRSA